MSAYKCVDCGAEFDEPREYRESRGECFGFPAFETLSGCPFCLGDYEETTEEEEDDEEC